MKSVSIICLTFCGFFATAFGADRPNVLFIAVDDLYPTLGAYGDPVMLANNGTPEIDTLASLGTTFLNHHVQWAVCGPSRAALTTSLMPEETGVVGFRAIRHPDNLPDVIMLPEHFRNNGYETAASGKFHDNRTVGDTTQPISNNQFPDGNSIDDPASWSIPWTGGGSGYSPAGKPAIDFSDRPDADYIDHSIMTNALGLIDTLAAGDKPFFLAVGFKKPHLPFVVPKAYWDIHDSDGDGNYDDDFDIPSFLSDPGGVADGDRFEEMLDFNNEILGYDEFIGLDGVVGTADDNFPDGPEIRLLRHGYYASTSFIDSLVGVLRSKLASTADPIQVGKMMDETTIIVFWGDHGFYLGEHSKWAKHTNSERSTRAPLIIYDPRAPGSGASTWNPAQTIDLYPTLCELAGLPIPEQPLDNLSTSGRPLRGRSLVPVLENPTGSFTGGAVSQFNKGQWGYSYRTENYRLIEWINGAGTVTERDLFRYDRDLLEKLDVASDPDYGVILRQLSVALRAEPATQGMTRLQSSAPAPVPADVLIPELRVVDAPAGNIGLSWPGVTGVTYTVVSNTDLGPIWNEVSGFESITGGEANIPIVGDRGFFQVQLGTNLPPRFTQNPLTTSAAEQGAAYVASLASLAVDPDSGGSLTFEKIDGPAWLTVASNGTLGGIPHSDDLGANFFTVSVSDPSGASVAAMLQVTVTQPSLSTTTLSFEPVADVFIKESDADANFGANKWLELSENSGNGTRRYSYLRFNVSGIPASATITSVEFVITPNIDGGTPFPEYGNVDVYDVLDDTWDESLVTWNNATSGLRASLEAPNAPVATLVNSTGSSDDAQVVDLSAAGLVSGDGLISLGLRTQDNGLGRFSSSNHASEPAPRLEVTFVE